ncbi:hypothetical protein NQ315_012474 [Exocentrus adspersus]|uniref:DUF4817 domain-containing protein n=1 Tax=Exocentrus adspersus TaxID=1586481 RepID=A0AAV8VMY0_9CUCU|nr:hypothetical protein NQ315_012474 [Exocentrus adspersus]
MVYAIGESDGNCFLAARIYAQKYPNRSHPDVRSLQNLKERFERTGSVSYEKKSRTPTVLNDENQLAISLAVVENPQVTVRVLSNDLNIKNQQFQSVCKRINFIRTMTNGMAWPPRSADLTPMDYFLWRVVESDVYRVPATTREDMVERIQQSFQQISPLVLSNVRRYFRRRAELCLTENGHHFEQLL